MNADALIPEDLTLDEYLAELKGDVALSLSELRRLSEAADLCVGEYEHAALRTIARQIYKGLEGDAAATAASYWAEAVGVNEPLEEDETASWRTWLAGEIVEALEGDRRSDYEHISNVINNGSTQWSKGVGFDWDTGGASHCYDERRVWDDDDDYTDTENHRIVIEGWSRDWVLTQNDDGAWEMEPEGGGTYSRIVAQIAEWIAEAVCGDIEEVIERGWLERQWERICENLN